MVILWPVNLRWVQGALDDPKDLCAHGDVEFRIDGETLLEPNDRELTMSAASLYLLRTLSVPHTMAAPIGDHLFPCCGFAMWDVPGQEDAAVCGCPNGEDFEVLHDVNGSGVVVHSTDGRQWTVGWSEWREAVFAFADKVSELYAASSPKEPSYEDSSGFEKFKMEWKRRRGQPIGG